MTRLNSFGVKHKHICRVFTEDDVLLPPSSRSHIPVHLMPPIQDGHYIRGGTKRQLQYLQVSIVEVPSDST